MKQTLSNFAHLRNSFLSKSSLGAYEGPYDKRKDKINNLQYQRENDRDLINHLRNEIAAKDKEIKNLKVLKNKKENDHLRTLKVIEEILRQCDQTTNTTFNVIADSVYNNKTLNNDNEGNCGNCGNFDNSNNNAVGGESSGEFNPQSNVGSKEEQLPMINKNNLNFTLQQKKIMRDLKNMENLKKQIEVLNKEKESKDMRIKELEKNSMQSNFNKLQNNYVRNFKELNKIKREKESIMSKFDDMAQSLLIQKEDNLNLRNKFKCYKDKFKEYKKKKENDTKILSSKLEVAQSKERVCKIFHQTGYNTGKNAFSVESSGFGNRFGYNTVYGERRGREKSGELGEENKDGDGDDAAKKEVEDLRRRLKEAEKEMKNYKKSLRDIKIKSEKISEENSALKKEIDEKSKESKKLEKEDKKLRSEISDLKVKISDILLEKETLEEENEKMKAAGKKLSQSASEKLNDKDIELEMQKKKFESLQEILVGSENENKALKTQVKELGNKVKELETLIDGMRKKEEADAFFITSGHRHGKNEGNEGNLELSSVKNEGEESKNSQEFERKLVKNLGEEEGGENKIMLESGKGELNVIKEDEKESKYDTKINNSNLRYESAENNKENLNILNNDDFIGREQFEEKVENEEDLKEEVSKEGGKINGEILNKENDLEGGEGKLYSNNNKKKNDNEIDDEVEKDNDRINEGFGENLENKVNKEAENIKEESKESVGKVDESLYKIEIKTAEDNNTGIKEGQNVIKDINNINNNNINDNYDNNNIEVNNTNKEESLREKEENKEEDTSNKRPFKREINEDDKNMIEGNECEKNDEKLDSNMDKLRVLEDFINENLEDKNVKNGKIEEGNVGDEVEDEEVYNTEKRDIKENNMKKEGDMEKMNGSRDNEEGNDYDSAFENTAKKGDFNEGTEEKYEDFETKKLNESDGGLEGNTIKTHEELKDKINDGNNGNDKQLPSKVNNTDDYNEEFEENNGDLGYKEGEEKEEELKSDLKNNEGEGEKEGENVGEEDKIENRENKDGNKQNDNEEKDEFDVNYSEEGEGSSKKIGEKYVENERNESGNNGDYMKDEYNEEEGKDNGEKGLENTEKKYGDEFDQEKKEEKEEGNEENVNQNQGGDFEKVDDEVKTNELNDIFEDDNINYDEI